MTRKFIAIMFVILHCNTYCQIDTCHFNDLIFNGAYYRVIENDTGLCTCVVLRDDAPNHAKSMVGILIEGRPYGPWHGRSTDTTSTYQMRFMETEALIGIEDSVVTNYALFFPEIDRKNDGGNIHAGVLSNRMTIIRVNLVGGCLDEVIVRDGCAGDVMHFKRVRRKLRLVDRKGQR